ncbi:MAG: adenylate/guanylate cyclase domain-containing protein [Bacteroidales bacterium]
MNQRALMDELDGINYQFDQIIESLKAQKHKTIGEDSYMCAGGIPVKNITKLGAGSPWQA